MPRPIALLLLLPLAPACAVQIGPELVRECDDRQAWYPDEDGDGVGEPTAVYIGCERPEGYVEGYEPADTGDTGDTGR